MRAKDIMIPLNEFLTPDTTIREAAFIMKKARRDMDKVGVKALPVIDEMGKLAGIITIGDILKAVCPPYMSMMNLGEFAWDGMVEAFAKKARKKLVADLMSKKVVTVKHDSTLMECVEHMIKHDVKRVPVLDAEGNVSGMLYETDIFFAITEAMLSGDEAEDK